MAAACAGDDGGPYDRSPAVREDRLFSVADLFLFVYFRGEYQ